MDKLNSYSLSRTFFNWSFDNPDLIKPNHIALYFFIIEHANRLGWKKKFGIPTIMVMEAIGIKNFRTYSTTLQDLIKWKFIKLIQVSKNQYSSNIISLVQPKIVENTTYNSSLDFALNTKSKNDAEVQSNVEEIKVTPTIDNDDPILISNQIEAFKYEISTFKSLFTDIMLDDFFNYWSELTPDKTKMKFQLESTFGVKNRLHKWKLLDEQFKSKNNAGNKTSNSSLEKIANTIKTQCADIPE